MENILEKASVTESIFTTWLIANEKYEEARTLTYGQFVTKFVYDKRTRCWNLRKKGFTIGQSIWVPPTTGELFYLRMMLTVVKGPITYEDMRKVDGTQYFSFRDACFAMGFLEDYKEFILAIKEASAWGSGQFLWKLFIIMLLFGTINRPSHVWINAWKWLLDGLSLNDEEIQNLTLVEIEKILLANRRTLKDFCPIPYPNGYVLEQLGIRLIYDKQNYDVVALKSKFATLYASLTGTTLYVNVIENMLDMWLTFRNDIIEDEQNIIFGKIIKAVTNQKGGVCFLHGHGGTRKTFMWRTLATYLRSKHQIMVTVVVSGIVALLLPGGRIAHSKFKIPVPTLDKSL